MHIRSCLTLHGCCSARSQLIDLFTWSLLFLSPFRRNGFISPLCAAVHAHTRVLLWFLIWHRLLQYIFFRIRDLMCSYYKCVLCSKVSKLFLNMYWKVVQESRTNKSLFRIAFRALNQIMKYEFDLCFCLVKCVCRWVDGWTNEWGFKCTYAQYLMGGCGEERKEEERKVFTHSCKAWTPLSKVELLALRWTDRPGG